MKNVLNRNIVFLLFTVWPLFSFSASPNNDSLLRKNQFEIGLIKATFFDALGFSNNGLNFSYTRYLNSSHVILINYQTYRSYVHPFTSNMKGLPQSNDFRNVSIGYGYIHTQKHNSNKHYFQYKFGGLLTYRAGEEIIVYDPGNDFYILNAIEYKSLGLSSSIGINYFFSRWFSIGLSGLYSNYFKTYTNLYYHLQGFDSLPNKHMLAINLNIGFRIFDPKE